LQLWVVADPPNRDRLSLADLSRYVNSSRYAKRPNARFANFSHDGSLLVTVLGARAQVRDALSGKPVGEPLLHEDNIYHAAFSQDDANLITSSEDKTARIWAVRRGNQIPARSERDRTLPPQRQTGRGESSGRQDREDDISNSARQGEPTQGSLIAKLQHDRP